MSFHFETRLSSEIAPFLLWCYNSSSCKGEGSCSPFSGWSSGVTQGTLSTWHFQKFCQPALLIVVTVSTLKRVPRKTLFSQGLRRFSYSIVKHLKEVLKSTISIHMHKRKKTTLYSEQTLLSRAYICNWWFPALSVPSAAENPTGHRNHWRLAPVPDQRANRETGIAFSATLQTDGTVFSECQTSPFFFFFFLQLV